MADNQQYTVPCPILDAKEEKSLVQLTERYDRLLEPGKLKKFGTQISSFLPDMIKNIGKNAKAAITERELYMQAMNIIADGFSLIQEQAAKYSISEKAILKKVSAVASVNNIRTIDEICFARSYDISKIVGSSKIYSNLLAFAEGGVTGAFGFAGLPFNLVLSTFLFYRAVQKIAMFYGYDVKNDASELVIAGNVFINSIRPGHNDFNEISSVIGKVMLISEATAVKQVAKRTWGDMASRGGAGLVLTQMRALAHIAAQKALEKAGKQGLEKSIFKTVFEQIGRKLTLKVIRKSIPVISGGIGALFDAAQMNKVIDYADVFYNKRFILEKEQRISALLKKIEAS